MGVFRIQLQLMHPSVQWPDEAYIVLVIIILWYAQIQIQPVT